MGTSMSRGQNDVIQIPVLHVVTDEQSFFPHGKTIKIIAQWLYTAELFLCNFLISFYLIFNSLVIPAIVCSRPISDFSSHVVFKLSIAVICKEILFVSLLYIFLSLFSIVYSHSFCKSGYFSKCKSGYFSNFIQFFLSTLTTDVPHWSLFSFCLFDFN